MQRQEQQQHEREVQETLLALGGGAPPQLSCKDAEAPLHDRAVAEADLDRLVLLLLLKSRHATLLGLQANGGSGSVQMTCHRPQCGPTSGQDISVGVFRF